MHLIFSDASCYKYSCRNIPQIRSKTWGWLKNHSEKATPSSSREALGCSCRVNACNHISNTTASALSPVNVDVVIAQVTGPRKQLQLQPPLLRLWAAPATKWTKRFGKQGQNVFNMSSVTISFQATPASSVKVLHSCCRMSAFGHKLENNIKKTSARTLSRVNVAA